MALNIDDLDPEGDVAEEAEGFPVYLANGTKFFLDADLRDANGDQPRDLYSDRCDACGATYLVNAQAGWPDDCPLCGERS